MRQKWRRNTAAGPWLRTSEERGPESSRADASPQQSQNITFIRAGEKPLSQRKVPTGLLSSAHDWQQKVDLWRLLKFPEHIKNTALRPDIVLTCDCTRQNNRVGAPAN